MTDPRRWSEDAAELSGAERRLLRAGLKAGVPKNAKRAVWVALAAQLPSAVAAATTAGAGAGGLASALGSMSLLKAAGAGVLLGATTITAATVIEHHQAARTSSPAPARAVATVSTRPVVEPSAPARPLSTATREESAPAAVLPEVGRARLPVVGATPADAPRSTPSVATFPDDSTANRPDAESRTIAHARSLLRTGQARSALAALDAARRDFPNGELAQERDALTIDALRVLGNTAEARRRATLFLARYPSSPHAPMARRALE